jgi:Cellulase (glycosyl hydrolase family 5)
MFWCLHEAPGYFHPGATVFQLMTIAMRLLAMVLAVACLVPGLVFAAAWSVGVDERQGLPVIYRAGTAAMTSEFAFWGKDWLWAGQETTFKVLAPLEYGIAGSNRTLGFELAGRVKKPSVRQLTWEFELNAGRTTTDVVGGGMVFKFDLVAFGREMGEPELLPFNRGWAWGRKGGSRMEVRFDPPLALVYFERGRKSEVRGFFYKGEIAQGRRSHTAVLQVTGDTAIVPTVGERFGLEDQASWPSEVLDLKRSPIDLSFLNESEKPAGRRGFLSAKNDKFVFEDGTTARFWGTNLTAYALFGTSKDAVRQEARRLSELGFNLVRLHHHDSPWVVPNIFGEQKMPDTRTLNSEMLDRLDWWIKCLKDEGIYVWLDLHVQRNLKAGDQIEGFDEIRKGQAAADLKGYNYVNPDIQQAMKQFNEAYVNHRNSYTGLRYKDEPSIAAMLITNENDVTHHFANLLLPDKNVPRHNGLYMNHAHAYAAAWGLSRDRTWRSWEHGPSKLFLNDLEQRFNADMIAHLRALGVRVPLATTSYWGAASLSALPALTAGNTIDVHSYGGVGELERNPIHVANMIHWIAAAQVAGKPLSVTEWNIGVFPAPDRHAIPLFVAGSASLQGWNALMHYAHAQEPIGSRGTASNWHAYNDPSLIATMPAAALLYRRGHVGESKSVYAYTPGVEQLFNQDVTPGNAAALRTAAEKGRLVVVLPRTRELPWLEPGTVPTGARVIVDPGIPLLDAGAAEAVSDSGELRRNWEQGVFTIDTPMTQAAMGWIGGKPVNLGDVTIAVTTRNATVAVQSLTGKGVRDSDAILISLGARSVPKAGNQLPFHSEPVRGQVIVRGPAGLKLYSRREAPDAQSAYKTNGQGSAPKAAAISPIYKDGRYFIDLDANWASYWLVLKK